MSTSSIEMHVQDANWQVHGKNSFEPRCEMFQGLIHRKRTLCPMVYTSPVVLPVSRRSVAEAVEKVRMCLAKATDNVMMGLCICPLCHQTGHTAFVFSAHCTSRLTIASVSGIGHGVESLHHPLGAKCEIGASLTIMYHAHMKASLDVDAQFPRDDTAACPLLACKRAQSLHT